MGRRFIISLGFHEDRAIRRLMASSASKDDEVVLITASSSSGVLRAYDSLVSFCRRAGLREPKLVEVPTDLYEGVAKIAELVLGSEGPVVMDLSGGMRYLAVLGMLALFLARRRAVVYVQPEGEGQELEIPESVMDLARISLQDLERSILKVVAGSEGVGVEDVARSLGRSPKTVANAVSRLQKLGLVVRRGRSSGLYLTSVGRLAVLLGV